MKCDFMHVHTFSQLKQKNKSIFTKETDKDEKHHHTGT